MALLPKFTNRGRNDGSRGLYNPLNPRHIILSIRADYVKRLEKLNETRLVGKRSTATCYKNIIKATYQAEKHSWKPKKGSKLYNMVMKRRKLDQSSYKTMEKLPVTHNGQPYMIPIRKNQYAEIAKWGDNRVGFAFANLRSQGTNAQELKEFLE